MALERLRRSAAQPDDRHDDETDATSGEDADATSGEDAAPASADDIPELDTGGSRLGTIKKAAGVALAAATVIVAVRRLRGRGDE